MSLPLLHHLYGIRVQLLAAVHIIIVRSSSYLAVTERMKCLILLSWYSFLNCALADYNEDKTLGMSKANPGASCNEIYQHNPTSMGNCWPVLD